MAYTQYFDISKERESEKYYDIDENKPFQVEKIEILDKSDLQLQEYEAQEEIKIRIHCISRKPVLNLYGYFSLRQKDWESLIVCDSKEDNDIFNDMPKGRYIVDINIPKSILASGEYYPYLSFSDGNSLIDSYLNGPIFNVVDTISVRGKNRGALTSLILDWNIVQKNI
jgi:hypothetical protein